MRTKQLTAPTVAIEQIVMHWMDQAEYYGYVKAANGCTLYYTEEEELFGNDEEGMFGVVGFYIYRDNEILHGMPQYEIIDELTNEAIEEYNKILV